MQSDYSLGPAQAAPLHLDIWQTAQRNTMGNFGAAVTSLLDTYTKCLSLLKGTRNQEDDGALHDTHSALSASLRSDRARVRRVYASRLSKDGSRFEKGDGKSWFIPYLPWI
jgi:pectin methylesterase-like acyl-CoA thioesterase